MRVAKRKTVQCGGNISEYCAADSRLAEQVNADKTACLVQDAGNELA